MKRSVGGTEPHQEEHLTSCSTQKGISNQILAGLEILRKFILVWWFEQFKGHLFFLFFVKGIANIFFWNCLNLLAIVY